MKDIHGEEIKCPPLYWSQSLAQDQGVSVNGLIRREKDGRYFAHEGMGWHRIAELPADTQELWLVNLSKEEPDGW